MASNYQPYLWYLSSLQADDLNFAVTPPMHFGPGVRCILQLSLEGSHLKDDMTNSTPHSAVKLAILSTTLPSVNIAFDIVAGCEEENHGSNHRVSGLIQMMYWNLLLSSDVWQRWTELRSLSVTVLCDVDGPTRANYSLFPPSDFTLEVVIWDGKNAIICFTSVALIIWDNCPAASSLFPFQHTICTPHEKLCRNALRTFTYPRGDKCRSDRCYCNPMSPRLSFSRFWWERRGGMMSSPVGSVFNPEATLATRSTTFFNSFHQPTRLLSLKLWSQKVLECLFSKSKPWFALTLNLHQDAGTPVFGELF